MNRKKVLKKVLPLALSAVLFTGGLPAVTVFADAATTPITWDFSQGLGAWKFNGIWDYSGTPTVTYDSSVGDGAIKIAVDYSNVSKESWSEVKLSDGDINPNTPLKLDNCNYLTFDFYYNPSSMHVGSFKTKLYIKSSDGKEVVNVCPDIDLASGLSVPGTSLKKVKVKVPFNAVTADAVDLEVSVVGSFTDYKGDVYVDNITLGQK
ncbi:hypothetical protein [Pectinatus frisingensis]|uniref:hypothetical protein n=1 Tax=Pectinatus frisingensis TaxID=865 RepID=UPI0018C77192|nr:hypothetical protein [Pectinatus frisingensis]